MSDTGLAVAQGVGDTAQALAQYFGEAQTRKQQKWNFGQRKDLYDLLRWHTYGKQGDVIDPKKMARLANEWRKSMQPTFASMRRSGNKLSGGPSAGQALSIYAKQRLPLEGGFTQALQQQNISMTEQRDENLRRLMASLTMGG